MSNDYYNSSGNPANRSSLSSANMRTEFAAIGTAFNKLPALTGNGGKIVVINAGGTAMTVTGATLDASGNIAATSFTGPLTGTASNSTHLGGAAAATYAPLNSPTFTGVPRADTAAADTNTTQLATTQFVIGQGYLKSAAAASTYVPLTRTVSPGTGLSGGGALSSNITLSLASIGAGGTVGGNNSIPSVTFDAYGRVTGISAVTPSGTWGINVSGSAATLTLQGVTEAAIDTATTTGVYNVSYSGYSRTLWAFNGGGSCGTVQLEADYSGNLRWRNHTDASAWTSWRNILLSTNYTDYTVTKTGGGASGSWGISVTGSSASCTGNANTASTANALNTANNYQVNALGVGTSNTNAGTIYATGNITAYSDIRLKTDIRLIPDALAKVCALRGVTYKRVEDPDGPRHTGVIAQELQAVLPEAVLEHEDNGTLMVAYGNVIGLLIEAIKELRGEVAELRAAR